MTKKTWFFILIELRTIQIVHLLILFTNNAEIMLINLTFHEKSSLINFVKLFFGSIPSDFLCLRKTEFDKEGIYCRVTI